MVLCLFVTSTLASDGGGHGGGGGFGGRSIRVPAFSLPIPHIGFTFDKLPLFIPIPKIVLGTNKALVSKPVFLPDFGGFGGFGGGHGLEAIFSSGGGGGGHEGEYGGYDEGY